jgi:hypothetical protein
MTDINWAEYVLGFLTLVFLVVSALAVYAVFAVGWQQRAEIRSPFAKALYWYGMTVIAVAVLLVGVPLVLKIVSLIWRI